MNVRSNWQFVSYSCQLVLDSSTQLYNPYFCLVSVCVDSLYYLNSSAPLQFCRFKEDVHQFIGPGCFLFKLIDVDVTRLLGLTVRLGQKPKN